MKLIKNLCIIPARGGSKRIPNKNIKKFAGKPIITYAIEKALQSNLFDEIMVSTDNSEIATIAEKYGAKIPFLRSAKTSDDYSTITDVIFEVLNTYIEIGYSVQNFCVIFPTVPLLEVSHVIEGFNSLTAKNLDAVFSVKKYRHPIERSLNLMPDGSLKFSHEENIKIRTQDFPTKYYDAGQFYFANAQKFLATKKLISEKNEGIILNFLESVDIDNEEDWQLAEILYQKVKTHKHDTGFKS